jgi:hypothetical protein
MHHLPGTATSRAGREMHHASLGDQVAMNIRDRRIATVSGAELDAVSHFAGPGMRRDAKRSMNRRHRRLWREELHHTPLQLLAFTDDWTVKL